MKTRQPLSRALVAATGFDALRRELHAQITEELNVSLPGVALRGAAARWSTPRRRRTSARWASASARASRTWRRRSRRRTRRRCRWPCARARRRSRSTARRSPLAPDEVIITETPREGWSVASDSGATVALDLEITAELRLAGLARDAIRLIQEARKNSGLDVADRIALRWTSTDPAVDGGADGARGPDRGRGPRDGLRVGRGGRHVRRPVHGRGPVPDVPPPQGVATVPQPEPARAFPPPDGRGRSLRLRPAATRPAPAPRT